MTEVGIDDFSLRDVLKPEPPRVRRILSAVINFAKFREEQMAIYDQYTQKSVCHILLLLLFSEVTYNLSGKIK